MEHYAEEVGCELATCQAAFLLWCAPVIVVMTNVGIATAGLVIAKADSEQDVYILVAMYGVAFLFLWLSASFSSLGVPVTDIIANFALVMVVSTTALIFGSARFDEGNDHESDLHIKVAKTVEKTDGVVNEVRDALLTKLKRQLNNITVQAFLCYTILPLVPIYLVLSFLNQLCRRILCAILGKTACTKSLNTVEEKQLWLTLKTHQQIEFVRRGVEWASVLYKAMTVGAIVIVIVVGIGRITTIFLSVLVVVPCVVT